jgi:hypothetical protein
MKIKHSVLFLSIFLILMLSFSVKAQEEHWSKYKYPTELPEGAKIHYIVKGDTLWDLAEHYLGNPFLWPKIWEQNKYITDPDLIFPQDPLIIPEVKVVAEEIKEIPEEEIAEEPEEEVVAVPEAEKRPEEEEKPVEAILEAEEPEEAGLIAMASDSDLYCSPLIMKNKDGLKTKVVGAEEEHADGLVENDIIYINNGTSQGVEPGQMYTLIRQETKIKHPLNGDTLYVFTQVGVIKILVAQPEVATAQIIRGCDYVNINDYLIPYKEYPIPMVEEIPELDEVNPPTEQLIGSIFFAKDRQVGLGEYSIVYIDLGTNQQVKPGDFFRIVEMKNAGGKKINQVVGQLVVIKVEDEVSLCRITYSLKDFQVGCKIEPQ